MTEERSEQEFQDKEQKQDVLDIHDAVLREQELPEEGEERGPWWLYVIILGTFAFGFFYMGFYFGEFSFRPHVLYTQPAAQQQQAPEQQLTLMERGEQVYGRVCQSCHQSDGQGQEGIYPTLSNSPIATGNPDKFVSVILHGLRGELVRDGTTYNGNMPPWGEQLSNREIAAVATYVRSNFNNSAGEVDSSIVNEVRTNIERTSQWTIDELNQQFAGSNQP